MPELKLTVTAQVSGGPALSFVETLQPEGYGSTTILVPAGSTGTSRVKVRLPADELSLLLITAETYSDQVKIGNGTGTDERILPLEHPILLSGGALDLLTDHEELLIENSGTDDAVLTILASGDVTPP